MQQELDKIFNLLGLALKFPHFLRTDLKFLHLKALLYFESCLRTNRFNIACLFRFAAFVLTRVHILSQQTKWYFQTFVIYLLFWFHLTACSSSHDFHVGRLIYLLNGVETIIFEQTCWLIFGLFLS